ncbi:hypothetical protein [Myroides marinus]|uniref:hypothetical protein n=1 Tax=Myroides marinus TaxID=703342 RepID=UPI0025761472|nr:hypothetical protein [Myroides marinus]MDM1345715.1 hypothetical protein [Myroides marinus]
MIGIRYRNRVSGVQGVLIGTKSKVNPDDVFIIKTADGREYFGPAREFDVIR